MIAVPNNPRPKTKPRPKTAPTPSTPLRSPSLKAPEHTVFFFAFLTKKKATNQVFAPDNNKVGGTHG